MTKLFIVKTETEDVKYTYLVKSEDQAGIWPALLSSGTSPKETITAVDEVPVGVSVWLASVELVL